VLLAHEDEPAEGTEVGSAIWTCVHAEPGSLGTGSMDKPLSSSSAPASSTTETGKFPKSCRRCSTESQGYKYSGPNGAFTFTLDLEEDRRERFFLTRAFWSLTRCDSSSGTRSKFSSLLWLIISSHGAISLTSIKNCRRHTSSTTLWVYRPTLLIIAVTTPVYGSGEW